MIRVWDVSVFKNLLAKEPVDRYALLAGTAERAYLKASGKDMDSHLVISGGELYAVQDSTTQQSEVQQAQQNEEKLEIQHEQQSQQMTKKSQEEAFEEMMAELYTSDLLS